MPLHDALPARLLALILVLATGLCTSGCLVSRTMTYFLRAPVSPMPALEVRPDPSARRECLVVMLPGLYDMPDQILSNGMVREAARASSRCDFVAVDAHLGYFTAGTIVERLDRDILRIAEARGYRDVWVVGISMGALGALLVARAHPDRVRGVVLLSVWLGDEEVVGEAIDAGGLRAWEPPELAPDVAGLRADTTRALAWIRDRAESGAGPAVYVGVARDDRYAPMGELVAAEVPADRVVRVAGDHGWAAWRQMWGALLRRPPWGR